MKIMLALPFALLSIAPPGGKRQSDASHPRQLLDAYRDLADYLRHAGCEVYCALEECGWSNMDVDLPEVAVERDWRELCGADHLVACPLANGAASGGVHVEIGWATALKKPVTVLAQDSAKLTLSVMVTGLHIAFDATVLYYQHSPKEVRCALRERVTNRGSLRLLDKDS